MARRSKWMTVELARSIVDTGRIRGRRATASQYDHAVDVLDGRIQPFLPEPERIEDYLPPPAEQARLDRLEARLRERGRQLAEELGDEEPFPNPSGREPFISDMGESLEVVGDDGSRLKLGRYGVWKWTGRKHEVVDTGDDLEALKTKHGIRGDPVRLRSR